MQDTIRTVVHSFHTHLCTSGFRTGCSDLSTFIGFFWSVRSLHIFYSTGATTHCGFVFCSPLAGYGLFAYDISWSHTTTRHSQQDSSGRDSLHISI